jgi:hypothetical protein
VEEEKFRKAGKKKYEQLSERMLQLFARLNALTSGLPGPHIDARPNLDGLSAKGRGLLKGRFKEKIELMHLQLSTAAAAAQTSANPSPTGQPASAASTTGPGAVKAVAPARKNTSNGTAPAHHSAITNVFDFAENIGRTDSHDHGAEKGGVAPSSRAPSDHGDKENLRGRMH